MTPLFKNIKRITVGDYPEGKIGNCFIYGMSLSQSFSSAPASLSISLVPESSSSSDGVPNTNLNNLLDVKVDGDVIFRGYISFRESADSANSRTIKLTLIDKSIRLDQYGIGLFQRHGGGDTTDCPANLDITCVDCVGGKHPVTTTGYTSCSSGTLKRFGNLFVIGHEKPSSSKVDIREVEYNHEEFTDAMNEFSSSSGLSVSDFPQIHRGRNYTGTIRDVLNSLCSDAGYTFYYDSRLDDLQFVSLEDNLIDLDDINRFRQQSDIAITSSSSSRDHSGTFVNFASVRHIRAGSSVKHERNMNLSVINSYYNPVGDLTSSFNSNDYNIVGFLSKANAQLAKLYFGEQHDFRYYGAYGTGIGYTVPSLNPACVSSVVEKCLVSTWAEKLQIPEADLKNILFNKPVLQSGFTVFPANIDPAYEENLFTSASLAVENVGKYYSAIFTPDDIARMYQQNKCDFSRTEQSPSPEWVEAYSIEPGWYFSGNSEWWVDSPDIGDILTHYQPHIVPTDALSATKYGNYSHLIFQPNLSSISSVSVYVRHDAISDNLDCAPNYVFYNAGKRKPCDDADDVTVENACNFINCNPSSPPEGVTCGLMTAGVRLFFHDTNASVTVESPWYSGHGFRSNVKTSIIINKFKPESKRIEHANSPGGHDFMKLNIHDLDVTSEVYDPTINTQHFLTREDEWTKDFETHLNLAKETYANDHRTPIRSEKISFNGFPQNTSTLLNPKGLSSFSISFGEGGIEMSLEYTDRPKVPPAMDYLASALGPRINFAHRKYSE